MIDYFAKFQQAHDYDSFLQNFGGSMDQAKWNRVLEQVELTDAQQAVLAGFVRQQNILCMAGAWCGDCARQCPIVYRFCQIQPHLQLRFLDRDADEDLRKALHLCGAPRVPQFVFLDEDGEWIGRYGDRTVSEYRNLAETISGSSCSIGTASREDPLFQSIVNDWLVEIERVQLILRTSPRLRERHGD